MAVTGWWRVWRSSRWFLTQRNMSSVTLKYLSGRKRSCVAAVIRHCCFIHCKPHTHKGDIGFFSQTQYIIICCCITSEALHNLVVEHLWSTLYTTVITSEILLQQLCATPEQKVQTLCKYLILINFADSTQHDVCNYINICATCVNSQQQSF